METTGPSVFIYVPLHMLLFTNELRKLSLQELGFLVLNHTAHFENAVSLSASQEFRRCLVNDETWPFKERVMIGEEV